MSTTYTLWCNTDDEGGPDLDHKAGGVTVLDKDAWHAWLIEHEYHDISLVPEGSASGLPFIQASRGGITFQAGDEIEAAYAWADYRKEYGVHADRRVREREHAGFLAGYAAARGKLDIGGVQR